MKAVVTLIAVFLVAVVSCNDPTEVTVFAPLDTVVHFDTTVVHDTIIEFVPVVDTLLVYCWLVDENRGHSDPPVFQCSNGYLGPRI